MKINKLGFFLYIIMFFSITFGANSNAFAASPNESSVCHSNSLQPYSFEICKEDVAFRIYFQFFPEIWTNAIFNFIKLNNAEEFINDPELVSNNQYLKFSYSFKEIFKQLENMVHIIFIIYFIYFTLINIIKSIENGNFLKSDWNIKDSIIGFGLSFLLLSKIGGVFIAQILLMIFVLAGNGLANFVFGYYLFSISEAFDIDNATDQAKTNYFEHNHFFANNYINDFTKINLCKQISEQYNIEMIGSDLDKAYFDENKACFISENKAIVNNIDTYVDPDFSKINPFIHYNTKRLFKTDDVKNSIISSINFNNTTNDYCSTKTFTPLFNCGTLNLTVPNIYNNVLINNFISQKFYDVTNNVISNLLSKDEIDYSLIYSGWLEIENYSKVQIEKIKSLSDDDILKKLDPSYVLAYRNIVEGDNSLLKETAYNYHQLVLNALMSGNLELSDENDNLKLTKSNISNFLSISDKTSDLALMIQEYLCLSDPKDLDNSFRFLKKINEGEDNQASNARCIDFKNNKVFGLKNDGTQYTNKELSTLKEELFEKIKKYHKSLIDEIYNKRTEVEKSYIKTIYTLSNQNELIELRKKGWLYYGSYIIALGKKADTNNINKINLLNSVYFKNENYNEKFISNDIYNLDYGYSKKYKELNSKSNLFSDLGKDYNTPSDYVDKRLWQKEILSNNSNEFLNGNFSITDYLILFINPVKPLKESLGIVDDSKILFSFDKGIIDKCSTDPTSCPMPTQNPFINLSNLGHYYINAAAGYFTAIAAPAFIMKSGKQNIIDKGSLIKDPLKKGGSIEDGKTIFKSKWKTFGLDIVTSILSTISFFVIIMLIVGLLFAYILPLLPFIYYMTGFLSLFTLFLSLMFLIILFSINLIRYNDNKREILNFITSHLLIILLKPIFMLASFIFIYAVFSVVIFFFNITVGYVISETQNTGTFLSILSSMISLFVMGVILYVIIDNMFTIMQNSYNNFFEIIEVRNAASDNATNNALKNSLSSDNLLQTVIGYQIFSSLTDKAKNQFGPSYGDIKKQAKQFSKNRLTLYESLLEKYGDDSSEEFLRMYKYHIQKDSRRYGKIDKEFE